MPSSSPGLLAYAVIMATFTNLATDLAIMRDSGVLKRLRGTPLPASAFVAGKIASAVVVAAAVSALTLLVAGLAFGVSVPAGNAPGLVLALVAGTACCAALGIGVTGMIRSADSAAAVTSALVLPLTFISGVWGEFGGLPEWLHRIAQAFPIQHLANALQVAFDPRTAAPGISGGDLLVLGLWLVAGAWLSLRVLACGAAARVTASPAMAREPTDPEPPALLGPGGTVALFAFLLFLGFPVADFLRSDPSPAHIVLVVAALVAFVGLYLRVMLAPHAPRETTISIAVMALLALALGLDPSAEWATLFVYVAAACGFRLRTPEAERGIAAATVAVAALSFGHGYPVDDSISYVLYALAIGALLRGYAHLVALNDELRAARGEIARLAVGEERLRFARDLHDLLGHSLSVIALKSELARRVLRADPERAEHEVRDIEQRDPRRARRGPRGGQRLPAHDARRRAARRRGRARRRRDRRRDRPRPRRASRPRSRRCSRGRCARARRTSSATAARAAARSGCTPGSPRRASRSSTTARRSTPASPAEGSGLAGLEERVRRRAGRLEAGRRPEGGFRLAVDVPANP